MYNPSLGELYKTVFFHNCAFFLQECLQFTKKYLSLQPLTRKLADLKLELFNGVMVAQQILVLFVQVRILVEQQLGEFQV